MKWFVWTVLLGAPPIFVSVLIALSNGGKTSYYKLSDLSYWGITMCVSNITLLGGRGSDYRRGNIIGWSVLLVILLATTIGVLRTAEEIQWPFKIAVHIVFATSVYISNRAGNYI